MAQLSQQKERALAAVIDAAPDDLLRAINVQMQQAGGSAAAMVLSLSRRALVERGAIAAVFSPIAPLCRPSPWGEAGRFPRRTLNLLWTRLAERRGEQVEVVMNLSHSGAIGELQAAMADGLCAEAASIARGVQPRELGLSSEADADELAAFLDLAPVARSAAGRLADWMSRLDEERAAALRLAFRDADRIGDDARPRLMDMLAARLPGPGMVLRLVSAVTDRASERYVQRTELAGIGERLVLRAELLASSLRLDDRRFGQADVAPSVASLQEAAEIMSEFDLAFPHAEAEEGAWSARLAAARKRMTEQLETALRGTPRAVDRALPLGSTHLIGRMSRMAPDLTADPASDAVARARALLSIIGPSRSAAELFGCESLRRQAAEAVIERVDAYADQVLQALHDREVEDQDRALALLDVAAEFLALVGNAQGSGLIRRRAAVALGHGETA